VNHRSSTEPSRSPKSATVPSRSDDSLVAPFRRGRRTVGRQFGGELGVRDQRFERVVVDAGEREVDPTAPA
jgi:hypothetical protein